MGQVKGGIFQVPRLAFGLLGKLIGQHIAQSQTARGSVPWASLPELHVIGRQNTLIYPLNCKRCFWFEGVWTPRLLSEAADHKALFLGVL